ncbi:MAG TPA: hypothetical protein VIC33_17085 [Vicinamibacterales bacterium]|jgi:proline dehydrogenase
MECVTGWLRRGALACAAPIIARAARSYVAGPHRQDALGVADALAGQGFRTTIGYWDGDGDDPRTVAAEYEAAVDALAKIGHDSYLSIKVPALGGDAQRLISLVARSRRQRIRIHFDSLDINTADATWAAVDVAARGSELVVSASLPARWRRSRDDAEHAIATGIVPRIVKGQWADPGAPQIDLRAGYLDLVDRLAGRAPFVAIATHDSELASEAMMRLRAAGSDVELELLYGLPPHPALDAAARFSVPVRFYVPYGRAYLPYCLREIVRHPRLLAGVLRNAARPARGRLSPISSTASAPPPGDRATDRHRSRRSSPTPTR